MKGIVLQRSLTVANLDSWFKTEFGCSIRVYSKDNELLQGGQTLADAGLSDLAAFEYHPDTMQHIRQLENEWAQEFDVMIELCDLSELPFVNKALRLYQLNTYKRC